MKCVVEGRAYGVERFVGVSDEVNVVGVERFPDRLGTSGRVCFVFHLLELVKVLGIGLVINARDEWWSHGANIVPIDALEEGMGFEAFERNSFVN